MRIKTARHEPDHVAIYYVAIPRDFLKFHKYVTIVADVMFF